MIIKNDQSLDYISLVYKRLGSGSLVGRKNENGERKEQKKGEGKSMR